jgi:hypothetical protein
VNQATALLQGARLFSVALAAGCAPARWKNDLAKASAWINSSTSLYSWLNSLADEEIKLRNGPIFGSCLAALISKLDQQSQMDARVNPMPKANAYPAGLRSKVATDRRAQARQPFSPVEKRRSISQPDSNSSARLSQPNKGFARPTRRATGLQPLIEQPYGTKADAAGSMNQASFSEPEARLAQQDKADNTNQPSRPPFIRLRRGRMIGWQEKSEPRAGSLSRPDPSVVASLPKRAEQSLLRRLASESEIEHGSEPLSRSTDKRLKKERAERGYATPAGRPSLPAPSPEPSPSFRAIDRQPDGSIRHPGTQKSEAYQHPQAGRNWAMRIAERIGSRLHSAEVALNKRTEVALLSSAEKHETFLAQSWSNVIAGPVAPSDLLYRVRDFFEEFEDASGGVKSKGPAGRQSELPNASAPRPVSSPATFSEEEVRAARFGGVGATHQPEEIASLVRDPSGSASSPDDLARAPGTMREPPPSYPHQVAGTFSPFFASPSTWKAAFAEAAAERDLTALAETAADDDLDELAAKIKRILDDEARRNGIDV